MTIVREREPLFKLATVMERYPFSSGESDDARGIMAGASQKAAVDGLPLTTAVVLWTVLNHPKSMAGRMLAEQGVNSILSQATADIAETGGRTEDNAAPGQIPPVIEKMLELANQARIQKGAKMLSSLHLLSALMNVGAAREILKRHLPQNGTRTGQQTAEAIS